MAKVSKKRKKKSNNTNPIKKLSDIAPELAVYDKAEKQLSYALLFRKAKCTARNSAEKNFSTSKKSKIKSLFSDEYFLAVRYRLDFLLQVTNLSHDERNHWNHKFTEYYDKIKDLLFESLDNNVPNLDKFNELEREGIKINQGLDFDAGTYLTRGFVDKTTGFVKYSKPAKIRPETSGGNVGNMNKPKGKKRKRRSSNKRLLPTPRESEAWRLYQNHTRREVALKMGISPARISQLLKGIQEKLKAANTKNISVTTKQKIPTDSRGQELPTSKGRS